jgi:hypothetical protein
MKDMRLIDTAPSSQPAPTAMPQLRAKSRQESVLPAVLLGLGATLLTLFIEFQLLQATDVPLDWNRVAEQQRAAVSVELRNSDFGEANQSPLQVRARPIELENHPSFAIGRE